MTPPVPHPSRAFNAVLPPWHRTPVALIPAAAAAFIIGNLLLMIPWSAF